MIGAADRWTLADVGTRNLGAFNAARTRRGLAPLNARAYVATMNAREAGRASVYE